MLPSVFGHKAGFDTLKKTTELAKHKWIKYLTVWALSTDNLKKRSSNEVQGIIQIINESEKQIPDFMKNGVQVNIIGDIAKLPDFSQKILENISQQTAQNKEIILTVALVYGWQDEIVRATKRAISQWVDPENLDEKWFKKYLDTADLPFPDVIVRTWGNKRHSWFLLYDSAYSEYYFTDTKWPDFDEEELDKVIDFFDTSQRNFWK